MPLTTFAQICIAAVLILILRVIGQYDPDTWERDEADEYAGQGQGSAQHGGRG